MSKRQIVLDRMRAYGYHGDQSGFTRLYCEAKISLSTAQEAYRKGVAAKMAGARCDCADCRCNHV